MQPLTCSSHTVIYSEPSLLVFTGKQLVQFLSRGHSRVPVYSGNPRNVIGLLLVGKNYAMENYSMIFIYVLY